MKWTSRMMPSRMMRRKWKVRRRRKRKVRMMRMGAQTGKHGPEAEAEVTKARSLRKHTSRRCGEGESRRQGMKMMQCTETEAKVTKVRV